MKYRDSSRSAFAPRVSELPTVTSTVLKNATADVFDQVAAAGAVAITRHDRPRAVLMTYENYQRLVEPEVPGLDRLREEYQEFFERMQEPAQKEAAKRLFEATPEELGAAAVRGAQCLKSTRP